MIQRLVRNIVEYGIAFGEIKQDDQEMYTYGYTILLETSICIVAMGCIGALFDMLIEVIVFSAVFIPLRSFGGGIHADRDWKCILLSVVVTTGYCFILRLNCHDSFYYLLLVFNFMGILFAQSRLKGIRYNNAISSKTIVNFIFASCLLMSVFFFFTKEKYLAKGLMLVIFVWLSSFFANHYFSKGLPK